MKYPRILRNCFAALTTLLILAGCSNPVSPPLASGPAGPVGKVTFTIGGVARAVLPSVEQFEKITLSFVGTESSQDLDDQDFTEISGGAVTAEIAAAGSWEVSVKAYIGVGDGSPAAVSDAAKTISWAGPGNAVQVTGGDRFLLVSAASSSPGKLSYTITLPVDDFTLGVGSRIRIEQSGSVLDSLDDQNFADGEREITASIEATDLSLAAGFYVVDILIAKDDNTVAVYRKSVSIMGGLMTAIVFEPEDFLDPATAAAKVELEGLDFDTTVDSDSISNIDFDDPPVLVITGAAGFQTVFFTLTKTEDQVVVIGGNDAASVSLVDKDDSAGGSTAGDELAVFVVQDVDQGDKEFTITVTEAGRTGSIVVNVTVTQATGAMGFGLYRKAVDAEESAYAPVAEMSTATSLEDILEWLAVGDNITQDTSYLVLIDDNQEIAFWSSVSDESKTGVEITLRGIDMDTKNTGENWTVSWDQTSLNSGNVGGLIRVRSGTTLKLDNGITLDGKNTVLPGPSTMVVAMVMVQTLASDANQAELIMLEGSKIINAKSPAYNYTTGSAVSVSNNASSGKPIFTMKGGEISNNEGYSAIINVDGGGEFTMKGGKITGNTTARNYRGSVPSTIYIFGTGSSMLLEDGEISENNWRGVSLSNGSFTMTGGKITGNGRTAKYETYNTSVAGTGLYVETTNVQVIISGGEISGNGSSGSVGSAIMCNTDKFTLSGEVAIEGSIALKQDRFIFLDENFTNSYTVGGDEEYKIPIFLRATSSNYFNSKWGKDAVVFKPVEGAEALPTDLVDQFILGGGDYGNYDNNVTVVSVDHLYLKEDGTLDEVPQTQQYIAGVGFGEETSLSVVDSNSENIDSGAERVVSDGNYYITLKDATEYSGIGWYINGTKSAVTGSKLTLDTAKTGLAQVTVEAYKAGVPDTGTFMFNVQ
jgi:hypothetical protein